MNALKQKWDKLDPKLKYTVLTTLVAYALAKAAIPLDPVLEAALSLSIGSLVGYQVENAGSALSAEPVRFVAEDSGGLTTKVPDPDELAPADAPDIVPPLDESVDLPELTAAA